MDADLAFFRTKPWCAQLLDDPKFDASPTLCRAGQESTEDSLFAQTLNSKNTIKRSITLVKRMLPDQKEIDLIGVLMELGDGLNSGPHILHGGIIGAILDDCAGQLLTVNGLGQKKGSGANENTGIVTASMTLNYSKPIETPAVVIAWAKLCGKTGRKYWIDTKLEDSKGSAVECNSLWVEIKLPPQARL